MYCPARATGHRRRGQALAGATAGSCSKVWWGPTRSTPPWKTCTIVFPTAEQYHADPEGETLRRRGRPPEKAAGFVWPDEGPGFRDDQHLWQSFFPFPGTGALNRLVVHPGIVDFVERALDTTDLRVYQTGISAKYTGITNYEQPMHTDRNHSWLPAIAEAPWRHVEGFLYLSDVGATANPTHLVSVRDSVRSSGPPFP